MFAPDESKVRAAVAAVRDAFEGILAEHLYGDGVEAAPGLKLVGATVVMAAASHYARKMGLTLPMAAGIVSTSYNVGEVFDPETGKSSEPKGDDS